jgi:RNA polymerase sigma factor (sigma-70 family)
LLAPLPDGPSDSQLLARFTGGHDADALDALVRRHGPMVLGVCRRVLGDHHAAEDAFQATFLILVRKAGTLVRPDLVANWLYGVAYRVARKARAQAPAPAELPRQVMDMRSGEPDTEVVWRDVRRVLDEEVQRLPEKYRMPVVLCYLEGQTNEEASRRLGWPLGTVAGRLSRARDLLRSRLIRRGLALTAPLLLLFLSSRRVTAAVSVRLHRDTVHAALRVADGAPAASVAPRPVAELSATEVPGDVERIGSRLALLAVLAAALLLVVWIGIRTMSASAGAAPSGPDPSPIAEPPPVGGCHSGGEGG